MSAPTPIAPASVVQLRNRVAHQTEQWSARSTDGLWAYDRGEDDATTWTVTYRPSVTAHRPAGYWVYATSLPKARAGTAPGGWVWAAITHQALPAAAPRCTNRGWTTTSCPEPPVPGTDRCPRHTEAVPR